MDFYNVNNYVTEHRKTGGGFCKLDYVNIIFVYLIYNSLGATGVRFERGRQ